MPPLATRARTIGLLALCFVTTATVPALASPTQPADTSASDRVYVLRSMQRRGELDAADATRLVDEAMRRIAGGALGPRSSALSHCSMLARFEARAWAHARGGNLSYPAPPHQGYVESSTLPLRVYYETSSDKPMAQDSLLYAEKAWKELVDHYGYPPPFTDDEDGNPMQGLWLYVTDAGMGGGGYTEPLSDVPSTAVSDCSSRVVIDSVNPPDYVEETVYHEFVHTTQMATDCAEAISAFENFAVAAEHVENPYNYTFPYGFLPEFQAWPGYPVDYWTDNDGSYSEPLNYYQYGAALFPLYLLDQYGASDPAYLNTIWQTFAQNGTVNVTSWRVINDKGNRPNWFDGVNNLVEQHGSSFNDEFRRFAQWRAAVGARDDSQHFRYGADYPQPAVAATLYGGSPGSGVLRMREYGTQYVDYAPGSYRGGVRFTVTASVVSQWVADLMLWHDNAPPEVVPVEFTTFLHGTAEVPSVAQISGITLVVSQLKDQSHVPDEMDYDNERQVSYAMEVMDAPDAGPEPSGDDAGPLLDAGADAPLAWDADPTALDPTGFDVGGGCGCRVGRDSQARGAFGALLLGLLLWTRRRRARSVGR